MDVLSLAIRAAGAARNSTRNRVAATRSLSDRDGAEANCQEAIPSARRRLAAALVRKQCPHGSKPRLGIGTHIQKGCDRSRVVGDRGFLSKCADKARELESSA